MVFGRPKHLHGNSCIFVLNQNLRKTYWIGVVSANYIKLCVAKTSSMQLGHVGPDELLSFNIWRRLLRETREHNPVHPDTFSIPLLQTPTFKKKTEKSGSGSGWRKGINWGGAIRIFWVRTFKRGGVFEFCYHVVNRWMLEGQLWEIR